MSAQVTDVRIKRRPFLVSLLAFIIAIWGILLVLGGLGILLFSWWTDFGNSYEIFGIGAPWSGLISIVVGLIYLGITMGLWRMRFWAWIIAVLVTLGWVASTGYSITSSDPHWVGLIISVLILIYLFVIVGRFRGVAIQA